MEVLLDCPPERAAVIGPLVPPIDGRPRIEAPVLRADVDALLPVACLLGQLVVEVAARVVRGPFDLVLFVLP